MGMTIYKNSTKAGRAWVAKLLDAATTVFAREIDLVTDKHTDRTVWRDMSNGREPMPAQLRRVFEARDVIVYAPNGEQSRDYTVVMNSGRIATRFVLTVYAFDASGLPHVEPRGAVVSDRKTRLPALRCTCCGRRLSAARAAVFVGFESEALCRKCADELGVSPEVQS